MTPVAPDPSDPLYVPPSNFLLGNPPTYFDISTTAGVAGNIQVCLIYPPGSIYPRGTLPSLYHFEGGQWVDITTSRDLASHTVCGFTSSLSPFAVGYLIVTEDALDVKALRLASKNRADSDSWSVAGTIDAGDAAIIPALLDSIDAMGVVFEVYGSAGLVNAVAFAGKDCMRIRSSNQRATLVCRIKTAHNTVRAKFKRTSAASSSSGHLRVDAKFPRRSFNVSSLKSLEPIGVRVVTMADLGALASGDLVCKGTASKVKCKTA